MKKVFFAICIFFVALAPFTAVHAGSDTEYERALKLYDRGKYREAVNLFSDYVQKRPDPSAYYYMGYASYKLRKYREATEYFQQAFLIDPNFSLGTNSPAKTHSGAKTPEAP